MYDIIIVGGGVVGAFVARTLSAYKLKILILEKEADVCCGATKANSAIVHSGYSGNPGTLKAALTKAANEDFHNVCEELDVEFKRTGSLMVAFDEKGAEKVYDKYDRSQKNNINECYILDGKEALEIEPNLNPNVYKALYAKTTGVVNPWLYGIAACENAMDNGVEIKVDCLVNNIEKNENVFTVETSQGDFNSTFVINCAGVYSDTINEMIGKPFFKIHPRKGEYILLDKVADNIVNHVIFQARDSEGPKGVLVLPTVHGNILVGPTAEDITDKEDKSNTIEGLNKIISLSDCGIYNLPYETQIRTFAGVRPRPQLLGDIDPETGEPSYYEDSVKDFIIGESETCDHFINVAGIKSPGLTCANEIGKYVANIVKEISEKRDGIDFEINPKFSPKRRKLYRFADKSIEEKANLIKEDIRFSNIVCRCNEITEAEVVDAVHRNCAPKSVDGIKRRLGTSMGRCQGGFCMPHIAEILKRELNTEFEGIEKDKVGSIIFTGSVE